MIESEIELFEALRASLTAQWPDAAEWLSMPFESLRAKGLAHDHVRLGATRWLARVPRQSQMGLDAVGNLRYQKACFDRASASGQSPRCLRVIWPTPALPRGALIVDEVPGQAANLPEDLVRIAQCMGAVHRLALPQPDGYPPLIYADDPLRAMLEEVQVQAGYADAAGLEPAVMQQIRLELDALSALCEQAPRPERRLIAFDGHPGNFVIAPTRGGPGLAYLVDLEKCRYSYPGFDLAHASLYTSTTWDIEAAAVLSVNEVAGFYASWAMAVGPELASDALPWHLSLRKAMWLWSLTWCAKWRVLSTAEAAEDVDGEDWSAQKVNSTLAAHVRARVDHYLSAECVAWVLAESHQLASRFGAMRTLMRTDAACA